MTNRPRTRWITGIALALALAAASLAGVGGGAMSPGTVAAALPHWTGGIDLYRSGAFTTQQTWLWCTAADVQIARNVGDRTADHSRANQQRFFDYMRARNRYAIPVADGVDPAGWTAGLRHFVDARYRLLASRSFDAALRSAVTSLRRTNLPVAITVAHGNHAWLLTGFTATADPATTSRYTVTSVRVVGPLWGLQSRSYGYDMRPDTKLTPSHLRTFFTPWHYAGVRMAWEGAWVSVQPIGHAAALPEPAVPKVNATPKPTTRPSTTPALATSPSPASSASAEPLAAGVRPAVAGPPNANDASQAGDAAATAALSPLTVVAVLIIAAIVAALAIAAAPRVRLRRRPG